MAASRLAISMVATFSRSSAGKRSHASSHSHVSWVCDDELWVWLCEGVLCGARRCTGHRRLTPFG
eukprot:34708-Eustigmatos_ZCMA.PRE.1